ncbi:MAG: A/G-specific adenine glycosylase, partial [Pseudomonadota bacterium]|nr:A/G-specific adenine glycosylase [Pseudomonadota bacterium]
WTAINAEVRHTFTHFHLILTVYAATVPLDAVPDMGDFMPADGFRPSDLPTVMRKVFDIARAHVTADGGT